MWTVGDGHLFSTVTSILDTRCILNFQTMETYLSRCMCMYVYMYVCVYGVTSRQVSNIELDIMSVVVEIILNKVIKDLPGVQ